MRTRTLGTIATTLLLAVIPADAAHGGAVPAGERPADARFAADWTAWLGCWVSAEDPAGAFVCVLPGTDAASARIVTVEDDVVIDENVLRADGVARSYVESGCTGTERAQFSSDGRRVYTRAELDCNGVRRVSSGVLSITADLEWVEAHSVTVGEQTATRTQRYRAVSRTEAPAEVAASLLPEQPLAQEAARMDAAAPLELADVIEAVDAVGAPTVEALLGVRQQGFGLNAAKLAQLERAGVPASTIDIMVALSYPSKFAVQDRSAAAAQYGGGVYSSRMYGGTVIQDCYADPYWTQRSRLSRLDRYGCGFGYDRYGFANRYPTSSRYGYGYSPYGYDPYRWNDGRSPIVIVESPERGGFVTPGRGYTQGTASDSGRRAAPRAGERSTTTTGSGARASSPPPAPKPDPAPPPRRAKPRPPGGGGGGNQ